MKQKLPLGPRSLAQPDAFLTRFRDAATAGRDGQMYFGQQGTLELYIDLCQQRELDILESPVTANDAAAQEERLCLLNEQNTWRLLEKLYSLRQGEQPTDAPTLYPHTSDDTIVRLASVYDRQLAELIAVKDWLHDIAPTFTPAETSDKQWSNTRRTRARGDAPVPLDPDAPCRDGLHLHPDDQEYDRAVFRSVYQFLRRGQAQPAADFAIRCCKSWLAGVIYGGTYYSSSLSSIHEIDGGNVNRALWKMACQRAAHESKFDKYQRAIYALLTGSATDMLPVCETYEDCLYAYCVSLIESSLDRHIKSVPRDDFWMQEQCEPDNILLDIGVPDTKLQSHYSAASDDIAMSDAAPVSIGEVFHALANSDRFDIRAYAHDFHRVVQSYLIQDDHVTLVQEIRMRLNTQPNAVHPQELRFFVHLLSFLDDMRQPLPQDAVNDIVQTYIQYLMATEQYTLVASYLSRLPYPAQKSMYAAFLADLPIEMTKSARHQLLSEAEACGLPAAEIAQQTAALTLQRLQVREVIKVADINWNMDHDGEPVGQDLLLVRALEWFEWKSPGNELPRAQDTMMQLELANTIARIFLLQGQVANVATLLNHAKLWDTIRSIDDDESRNCLEYLNYNNLIETVVRFEAWTTQSRDRQALNRRQAIESAVQAYHDLLMNDWLVEVASELGASMRPEDITRRSQVTTIRQLYLPQILLDYQSLLINTSKDFPEHLAKSVDLVNLITRQTVAEDGTRRPPVYKDLLKYGRSMLIRFVRGVNTGCIEMMRAEK
ncbi:Nucleoporin nup84 [Sorochytrium milnesiophthora]